MKREPLLLPALALALGILIAHFCPISFTSIGIGAAAAVFLYASSLLRSPLRRFRFQALLVCAFVAGALSAHVQKEVRSPKLNAEDGDSLLVSGCVSEPPV